MRTIILAGGLGLRLRPRVPDTPKPMAPIAGRPFLEYLLAYLQRFGIFDVTLSVGYRFEAVSSHFGTVWHGMKLHYVFESEPLGTGGAILNAMGEDAQEPILVLNGDSFVEIDYSALVHWYHCKTCEVAMVVRLVKDTSRYGAVQVERGRVVKFLEKGRLGAGFVNAGVYVIQPGPFRTLSPGPRFSLEKEFLQRYCAALRPRAFVTDGFFIDIGEPCDYDRAQEELPRHVSAGISRKQSIRSCQGAIIESGVRR